MQNALVTCENLVKIYSATDVEVVALQGLDLEIAPGEMVALVGTSGSGKTTLLNLLGALDAPSAGRCVVAGNDLTRINDAQRTNYRCFTAGHVWQQSGRNLLPELTVAENIALPQMLGGVGGRARDRRTRELMERTGIGPLGAKRPNQISGGEQQRAAICVALANAPTLLLADEPTGELDSTTASEVLELLRDLNRELGLTILIVTHDINVASSADRTIAIRDGRTSTEVLHAEEAAEETVIIDSVGRLQIPKALLEAAGFEGRAIVHLAGDHLEVWPAGTSPSRMHGSGSNVQSDSIR